MARLSFECERTDDGVILRLIEKPWIGQSRSVPVDHWAERMADQVFSGMSKALALLDDAEHIVTRTADGLSLDYRTIASLTEPQALSLGLPPSARVALQVDTKNLIT